MYLRLDRHELGVGLLVDLPRVAAAVLALLGLEGGTLKNVFTLHTNCVSALVALPDNQHALSGSDDKTVKLFNVDDGDVLRTFTHHTYWVNSLALLPDGLRFVSDSHDNTARIAYHGLAP